MTTLSPAKQRAYEAWRRSAPRGTDRVVFDSAFDDVKVRAAAITRELTIDALSKACGRPPFIVLTAALQELIDGNVLRELHGTVEPRYAPARPITPDTRRNRRIWATDDEYAAINKLLESMRCPAKT